MTDPPGNLSPIRLKSSPGRRNARPLSLVIRTCSKALPAKRKVALCYREKGHERTKISLDTPEQRHFVLTSSKIALRPWMSLAVARDDSLANTSMLLDTMSWLVSSVFLICSVVIAPCGKKKKTLHKFLGNFCREEEITFEIISVQPGYQIVSHCQQFFSVP